MKLKKYILKGLSLLILCCVATTQISVYAFDNFPEQVTEEDNNNEKEQSYFTQISSETVVPSHDFSFNEINKFFSVTESFFFFSEPSQLSDVYVITPVNTYFIKLFGHHIAINAP